MPTVCGSKKWYQNGTLVNGTKDYNQRVTMALVAKWVWLQIKPQGLRRYPNGFSIEPLKVKQRTPRKTTVGPQASEEVKLTIATAQQPRGAQPKKWGVVVKAGIPLWLVGEFTTQFL